MITHVDLSYNYIDAKGALDIMLMLKETTSLRSLNLSNNHINNQGITYIMNGVMHNENIEMLNVEHNPFTVSLAEFNITGRERLNIRCTYSNINGPMLVDHRSMIDKAMVMAAIQGTTLDLAGKGVTSEDICYIMEVIFGSTRL